ncbi:chemotaxis protein CheW [Thaumasiovibrio sp. DFM-14]|uniref:chemotaxis protein CheW n=1 Tax=Thaumasiovibrio sp. DFM-14 TaxID=3384792 RepID=UPI0039A0D53B
MTTKHRLSSEQALEDYFSDLLDDAVDSESVVAIEPVEVSGQFTLPSSAYVTHNWATPSTAELPTLEVPLTAEQTETVPFTDADLSLSEEQEEYALHYQPLPQPSSPKANECFAEPEFDTGDVERLLSQLSQTAIDENVGRMPAQNGDFVDDRATEEELEAQFTALAEQETQGQTTLTEANQTAMGEAMIKPPPETQTNAVLSQWKNISYTNEVQLLYFEVCGVMFAVPLAELGGIHRMASLNTLPAKPAWYLGLYLSRDQQFDIVDTACWAMPDMLNGLDYKEKYGYIVMLGSSRWGLACEQLHGTQTVLPNMIRWREHAGKRPWLAGMVKDKMCALIHVEALIAMLDAGLDVKALA